MEFKPDTTTYRFDWVKHELKIIVFRTQDSRNIRLMVDGKTAFEHPVNADDDVNDAGCIKKAVREYSQSVPAKYRDIFEHHADKLILISKDVSATVSGERTFTVHVHITKGVYEYEVLIGSDGESMKFRINADSFSEAFEKIRMGVRILGRMSDNAAQHITELSGDDIMERFAI